MCRECCLRSFYIVVDILGFMGLAGCGGGKGIIDGCDIFMGSDEIETVYLKRNMKWVNYIQLPSTNT